MLDQLLALVVLAMVAVCVLGLPYIMIFRAHEWNEPRAVRGFGIAIVGVMIVGVSRMADPAAWADGLFYAGMATGVVGFFMGCSGLAES